MDCQSEGSGSIPDVRKTSRSRFLPRAGSAHAQTPSTAPPEPAGTTLDASQHPEGAGNHRDVIKMPEDHAAFDLSPRGSGENGVPVITMQENLEQSRLRLEALTMELNHVVGSVAANISVTCNTLASSGMGLMQPTVAVSPLPAGHTNGNYAAATAHAPPSALTGYGLGLPIMTANSSHGQWHVGEVEDDGASAAQEPFDFFSRDDALHQIASQNRFTDATMISNAKSLTKDLLPPERQKLVLRLQARLGFRDGDGIVFANRVFRSLDALGSEKYSMHEIEEMLVAIGQAYPEGFVNSAVELPATANGSMASSASMLSSNAMPSKRKFSQGSKGKLSRQNVRLFDHGTVGIRFRTFVRALLDADLEVRYNEEIALMILTIREVLISGDANRLVAKLMQVHVDELAAPEEKVDLVLRMEPIVAFVIFLNGILIGIQTDNASADDLFWMWADLPFSMFFLFEMVLKLWKSGCKRHFWSHEDWAWNWFDALVVFFAILDVAALVFLANLNTSAGTFTLIRIVRLTKLSRLLRMFHLKHMRELSLMVKGLVAGMRTLFWAIVLLFFAVYIIAVITTQSLGHVDEVPMVQDDLLFATVPRSMLTVFRCFVGDCEDSDGAPIVKALSDHFGWRFVLPYVAATVFVTFGLFNLIFAIYIETTLSAAKVNRKMSKAESLRVARLTKELLKKFCHAHNISADLAKDQDKRGVQRLIREASMIGELEDFNMTVSKELFLLVIQDSDVQILMDNLDIPPDREQLFDIIDADGSGDLEASELIRGLLSVRGEARKSDVVAALLAVRAVQTMIRELDERQMEVVARIEAAHRESHQLSSAAESSGQRRRSQNFGKLFSQGSAARMRAAASDPSLRLGNNRSSRSIQFGLPQAQALRWMEDGSSFVGGGSGGQPRIGSPGGSNHALDVPRPAILQQSSNETIATEQVQQSGWKEAAAAALVTSPKGEGSYENVATKSLESSAPQLLTPNSSNGQMLLTLEAHARAGKLIEERSRARL